MDDGLTPLTPEATRVTEWHQPVMGTTVELQLVLEGTDAAREGAEIISAVISEMRRLQDIFSSVDPESEFSRWLLGEVARPSEELSSIVAATRNWHAASGARFNPRVVELAAVWSHAEQTGEMPSPEMLQSLAASISELPWSLDQATDSWRPGIVHRSTLNAFAKGWVVDRAIEFASNYPEVRSVTINAGGDLRRSGPDPLLVGIENPFRPFDNEPPLATITLNNCALATSGSARKGFSVGERRFGHVIDPRTGWPIESTRSISVLAPTAAEADVLATILGVETPPQAINEANARDIAVLIVDADQNQHRSNAWSEIENVLS